MTPGIQRSRRSERERPDEQSTANRTGIDALAVAALIVQAAVSLTMRATAWPEVTTPAYLMSRGLLLYRDVKFVHTPGMMATLAGFWRILPGERALRSFMLLFPMLGHLGVLVATRRHAIMHRILASGFFLVFFYGWGGNAVWPTPMIAAMAIPLLLDLEKELYARAGAWLGLMIVCKQTAAYVLIAILIALLLQEKWRKAVLVGFVAAIPYAVASSVFLLLGAGLEYFRWTLVVPFTILQTIVAVPSLLSPTTYPVFLAFCPTLILTMYLRKISWLPIVAVGLSMIAVPRFDYLQMVAAVPCLALGLARALEALRQVPAYRLTLVSCVLMVLSVGIRSASTFEWDCRITYWNENPAFNRLVDRVRSMPPGPVLSLIWPNLLPRVDRLPPADLYALPWLWDFPGIPDPIADRVYKSASDRSCTIVALSGPTCPAGEKCGPYCIRHGGMEWMSSVKSVGAL